MEHMDVPEENGALQMHKDKLNNIDLDLKDDHGIQFRLQELCKALTVCLF